MTSIEDLLKMSNEELVKEIETYQNQIAISFKIISDRVSKRTDGEAFLKGENINVAEYWLSVGLSNPDIIASDYSMSDFAIKIAFFNLIVPVVKQDEETGAMLRTARETVAKDCAAYISYIRAQVKIRESNPVMKLILDKEPNKRKVPVRATPAVPTT